MKKQVLMLGAAMAAMNCLAGSTGSWAPYLGMFLYDYENGCVRWGSVAFLVCLILAIRWAADKWFTVSPKQGVLESCSEVDEGSVCHFDAMRDRTGGTL